MTGYVTVVAGPTPSYSMCITAYPDFQFPLPTQTGHPDFPEAAAEARGPSVSFAATKLPFVTSQLRPKAVIGGYNLTKLLMNLVRHLILLLSSLDFENNLR